MIYVIGDSHSALMGESPIVQRYGLSFQTTAHNLHKHKDEILSIISKNTQEKWWFLFGEVDCEIHINKQAIKYNNYIKPIYSTCVRYLGFLGGLDCPTGVFAIPPQGIGENLGYQNYADRATRQFFTDEFNACLAILAPNFGIEFADFLPQLRYGIVDEALFQDPTHLRTDILVENIEKWYASVNIKTHDNISMFIMRK